VAASGIDACSVGRALVEGEHAIAPTGAAVLAGPAAGGIWFADELGNLLDPTGASLPPATCDSSGGPDSLSSLDVVVRPQMTVTADFAVASVSMEVVVPVGAVRAGAWWRIPGCEGLTACRPSLGALAFELATWPDPAVAPAYSGDDVAFPLDSMTPLALNPTLPRGCGDRLWYSRLALDAGSSGPQHECFSDFVNDLWTP